MTILIKLALNFQVMTEFKKARQFISYSSFYYCCSFSTWKNDSFYKHVIQSR